MSEEEIKKKREWFEDLYIALQKNGAYFVYVQVASASIPTTSYEFDGEDKIVFLYSERKLVAIVYNIMDIEEVS